MPPKGWVAQAERCASAVPACFREDPAVVHIFMNGRRTFGGVEKMSRATLTWGAGNAADVNACLDRMPPRFSDDDVGIAPDKWDKFIADLNQTYERLPPDPILSTLTLHLVTDDDWKQSIEEHIGTTFGAGIADVSFEEAFWTEHHKPADAPAVETPETGYIDPVAESRTTPVVSVRLQFGTRAAFERFVADAAAQEAAPPAGAHDGDGAHDASHRRKKPVARAHSSLLPWARRWEFLPPTRMFGHRASFHAGV